MTLRKKTLLIIGLTLAALFLVLYFALSEILLDGFAKVEDQIARQNVTRVLEAYKSEVDNVLTITGDWAPWDDTYIFIEDLNEDYVTANLLDVTFINLSLNAMLFFNTSDELVFGKAFDLQDQVAAPVPDSVSDHFAENQMLLQHEETDGAKSGFILLPEGPMLVGSRPIVTNDYEGPIRGTLVMGRYLNNDVVSSLETKTQFSIDVHRLDNSQTTQNFEPIISSLPEPDSIYIQPMGNNRLAGYTILPDVYGQPGLLVQVEMPRPVFAQSQLTLRTLILSLVAVGIIFIVLTLLLLEKLVLARVARLHVGVQEIGSSGDLSKRLSFPGSDELSNLAAAINKMLEDLQASLEREKELKQEVQQLRIEIDQVKKQRQVSEIVETDFFQDLQAKAKAMRNQARERSSRQEDPKKLSES